MTDRIFMTIGAALFASMLAVLVAAGAALASSPMPALRPPYVGQRVVLVNRGWVRVQIRGGRKKVVYGPEIPL